MVGRLQLDPVLALVAAEVPQGQVPAPMAGKERVVGPALARPWPSGGRELLASGFLPNAPLRRTRPAAGRGGAGRFISFAEH